MQQHENYHQAEYWDDILGSWQDIPDGDAKTSAEALKKAMEFRNQGLKEGVEYVVSIVHFSRIVYYAQSS